MPSGILEPWLQIEQVGTDGRLRILSERAGARPASLDALAELVKDHLCGSEILARMNFEHAARVVESNLPTRKTARSGDLGEILGTEYVCWQTEFVVPVKRLRYKDDRNMAMRGDDVFGIVGQGRNTKMLKVEAKSRTQLHRAVIDEACQVLDRDDGRPTPATLAFIARILRLENRDAEATVVEELQLRAIDLATISHIVFTFSGNDPETLLATFVAQPHKVGSRHFVGLHIADHAAFIDAVFEKLNGN